MKPVVKLFRRVLPISPKNVNDRINSKHKQLIMEESSNSNSASEIDHLVEPTSSSSSSDLKALEDQIENLKAVVNNLNDDIESKEIGIAKLAREKEKLLLDLMKQKRSNTNILKQLEDERKFYFQEKEIYCQEMNEIKELKRSLSKTNISLNEKNTQELRSDLEDVRKKLKQTVEANYNLSIKFLRIKNTKTFLKSELIKMKNEHEKIFNDLKGKIEIMASEVQEIMDQRSHVYVSPSNRKYVQLVRQNSSLVHENLCLRMEIERLNSQFDKIKLKYTKSETNSRLKYAHSMKTEVHAHSKHRKREKKKVRIATEDKAIMVVEKTEKPPKSNLKTTKCQSEIIKIYERSESDDTPSIHIINENEVKKHSHKKHKKSCKKHIPYSNAEDSKVDTKQDTETNVGAPSHEPCVMKLESIAEIDEAESFNRNT